MRLDTIPSTRHLTVCAVLMALLVGFIMPASVAFSQGKGNGKNKDNQEPTAPDPGPNPDPDPPPAAPQFHVTRVKVTEHISLFPYKDEDGNFVIDEDGQYEKKPIPVRRFGSDVGWNSRLDAVLMTNYYDGDTNDGFDTSKFYNKFCLYLGGELIDLELCEQLDPEGLGYLPHPGGTYSEGTIWKIFGLTDDLVVNCLRHRETETEVLAIPIDVNENGKFFLNYCDAAISRIPRRGASYPVVLRNESYANDHGDSLCNFTHNGVDEDGKSFSNEKEQFFFVLKKNQGGPLEFETVPLPVDMVIGSLRGKLQKNASIFRIDGLNNNLQAIGELRAGDDTIYPFRYDLLTDTLYRSEKNTRSVSQGAWPSKVNNLGLVAGERRQVIDGQSVRTGAIWNPETQEVTEVTPFTLRAVTFSDTNSIVTSREGPVVTGDDTYSSMYIESGKVHKLNDLLVPSAGADWFLTFNLIHLDTESQRFSPDGNRLGFYARNPASTIIDQDLVILERVID